MHPFRYALTRGPVITRAPEDDRGSEFEDIDDQVDEVEDEPDDQEDEDQEQPDDEVDDLEDAEPEPQQQQRQPSRAENRVAALARERAAEKARADKLEADMAALRAQIAQQQQAPRETPQQFQERLAQMEPWERAEAVAAATANNLQAQLNQIRFESQDSADRTAYEALAARVPAAAKFKDEVEKRLAEMRAGGTTAPRETILRWVIGDRALANANRATGRAQKTATANRERQTARPGNGRGDAARTDQRGGNDAAARARRLENQAL